MIELLLVLGIIASLAAIVIMAINPSKQLAQTRNTQRQTYARTIVDAVYQYAIDNPTGTGLSGVTTSFQMLGTATNCNVHCGNTTITTANCLDISTALIPLYINSIPVDPSTNTGTTTFSAALTGYAIKKVNNRYTVRSCNAELGQTIEVAR